MRLARLTGQMHAPVPVTMLAVHESLPTPKKAPMCASHLRDALQPHASVNVPIFKWRQRPVWPAVALHEHEVVELDKAGVVLQRGPFSAPLGGKVVVQLAAGAAGSRWPARGVCR